MDFAVSAHAKHYLDVVEKYRADKLRSYHQHHLTINFAIEGPTDASALARAVTKLAAGNPALRSYFERKNGSWINRFHDAQALNAFSHERFDSPDQNWLAIARARVDQMNDAVFDIQSGPLFTVTLLEFPAKSVILTKWHHIVCDGWSILVALNQLLMLYEAEIAGTTLPLPIMSESDYAGFASRQNDWLTTEDGKARIEWWQNYLSSSEFLVSPLAERPQGVLGVVSTQLSGTDSQRVFAAAESNGFHASYLVHACFLRGLKAHLAIDDILVTFVKANRERSTGGVIANFADWVMVRHRLPAEQSLLELAKSAQSEVGTAKENYTPYWHIVEQLCPQQYMIDFGITPYSFDFVPPLQPNVDAGGKIKFNFLHELDAIPYRLVATDIFCRMSMHTFRGESTPRIAIDLIHHASFVDRPKVEALAETMKMALAAADLNG
jgi:hypothetical protein